MDPALAPSADSLAATVAELARTLPSVPEAEEAVATATADLTEIAAEVEAIDLASRYLTAAREKVQVSLNLAMGSAMASIGLTIPTIAVASIWLDGPLARGLDNVQIVLLFMTAVVSILTVVPGRAKPLQGGVHLVLLASFIFLTIAP